MSTPTSPATTTAEFSGEEPVGDALGALLRKPTAAVVPPAQAIVIGELLQALPGAAPKVRWPQGPGDGVTAASLVAVGVANHGAAVALSFAGGLAQPLILGLLWDPASAPPAQPAAPAVAAAQPPLQVQADEQTLEITAQQSLTLRCGQASITLTADGQVLLRGSYVSSHASGTQRIKGAAVRIN
jgi:Domain of unknown function (DUF6484)